MKYIIYSLKTMLFIDFTDFCSFIFFFEEKELSFKNC